MLKKILGEAPFCVEMNDVIVVSPAKSKKAQIVFTNDSEYDLPLSCTLKASSFINTDKGSFDVIVPAEGLTKVDVTFSVNENEKLFGGRKICELEIVDRIFDTKTLYEFEVLCELCYKCCENEKDAFLPSDEMIFSKDAVLFGNKGEIISLEIPCMENVQTVLHIIAGQIRGREDGDVLHLAQGLNRISFEMTEDGNFELLDEVSRDKFFADTLSTKYFM